MKYDELNYDINDLLSKLYLVSATFADDSTRNAGTVQLDKITLYATNLTLNESLYKVQNIFVFDQQFRDIITSVGIDKRMYCSSMCHGIDDQVRRNLQLKWVKATIRYLDFHNQS